MKIFSGRLTFVGMIIACLFLVITSCNKPKENTYLIPTDSHFVAIMDMDALITKGRLFNIGRFNFVQAQMDSNNNVKLTELLEQIAGNPFSLGLDFTEDAGLFISVRTYESEKLNKLNSQIRKKAESGHKNHIHLAQYEEEEDWSDYDYYDELEEADEWEEEDWEEIEEDSWSDYPVEEETYQWEDDPYSQLDAFSEVVYIGLTANISSKRKFSKFVNNQLENILRENRKDPSFKLDILEKENYTICFPDESIALAWDGDKTLLLTTPCYTSRKLLEEMANELFSMKKAESLPKKSEFREFYKSNQDVSLYLNSDFTSDNESIQSCMDEMLSGNNPFSMLFEMVDMLSILPISGNHLFGYLNFDDGAIKWTSTLHMDKAKKREFEDLELWENEFNKSLLKSFPSENIIAGSLSFKPTALYQIIKDLISGDDQAVSGDEIDSFLKDLIHSMDGSILFSVMDIKKEIKERTTNERTYNPKKTVVIDPETNDTSFYGGFEVQTKVEEDEKITLLWGLAIGLKDTEKMKEFITQFLKEENGVYAIPDMLYICFEGSVCLISTNMTSLDILRNGIEGKNLSTSKIGQNIEESNIYGYADLNINELAKKTGIEIEYTPISSIFESLEYKMVDELSIEFTLNLSDKNNNALYTLLKEGDREFRRQTEGL